MLRSLLIKLAMLVVTVGLVWWIGWRPEPATEWTDRPIRPIAAPEATATVPAKEAERERAAPPSASRPAATAAPKPTTERRSPDRTKVDLNRASVDELQALPGVGPVLARRIVEWRGSHGRFRAVEELEQVKGIGRKRMDQLRPLVVASLKDGQR
jgi:competence protein ComEA